MHLHAARGPPWRARVRPAGALGRPNQQEQHPKGPQATAQPEDRAGHPGFAAPQSGFYVAYTPRWFYGWALRGWLRAATATGIVRFTGFMTPVWIFSEKFKPPPLAHPSRAHLRRLS